jgi:hypothetical protein
LTESERPANDESRCIIAERGNLVDGLIFITLVICAINYLTRGRITGFLISSAVCILVLVALQFIWGEASTYAGMAYLCVWSAIVLFWNSFCWIACALWRRLISKPQRPR